MARRPKGDMLLLAEKVEPDYYSHRQELAEQGFTLISEPVAGLQAAFDLCKLHVRNNTTGFITQCRVGAGAWEAWLGKPPSRRVDKPWHETYRIALTF